MRLHSKRDSQRDVLQGLWLFSGLCPAALDRVGALATECSFGPHTVLFDQGAVAREALVVVTGEVEVSADSGLVARLGPGDPLGEMALLGGKRRSAKATTIGQVRALVFDPGAFDALLDEPIVRQRLLATSQSRREHRPERPVPVPAMPDPIVATALAG